MILVVIKLKKIPSHKEFAREFRVNEESDAASIANECFIGGSIVNIHFRSFMKLMTISEGIKGIVSRQYVTTHGLFLSMIYIFLLRETSDSSVSLRSEHKYIRSLLS